MAIDQETTDFLSHYGVLGMHWGHHKLETKAPSSEDHVTAKALRKVPMNQLSNTELHILTERLDLETKYRDLNKKKSTLHKGQTYAKEAVAAAGTLAAAYKIVNGPAGAAIKNALTTGLRSVGGAAAFL
jgi:hypothetical protein